MGPSGSGKSTLMHCLAGLDAADAGQILVGGTDITALNDKQLTALRRDRIGFVFQAFNLVPTLTAEQNITLPLALAGAQARHRHGSTTWWPRWGSRTGCATARTNSPAASSSAWRWPAPC